MISGPGTSTNQYFAGEPRSNTTSHISSLSRTQSAPSAMITRGAITDNSMHNSMHSSGLAKSLHTSEIQSAPQPPKPRLMQANALEAPLLASPSLDPDYPQPLPGQATTGLAMVMRSLSSIQTQINTHVNPANKLPSLPLELKTAATTLLTLLLDWNEEANSNNESTIASMLKKTEAALLNQVFARIIEINGFDAHPKKEHLLAFAAEISFKANPSRKVVNPKDLASSMKTKPAQLKESLTNLTSHYADQLKTNNKLRLSRLFGRNQKAKTTAKTLILEMTNQQSTALHLLDGIQKLGLLNPTRLQQLKADFIKSIENQMHTYATTLLRDQPQGRWIQKNPNKINNYIQRAIQKIQASPPEDPQTLVSNAIADETKLQKSMLHSKLPASSKTDLQRALAAELLLTQVFSDSEKNQIFDYDKAQYGGKFAGLQKLEYLTANTATKVPAFIGLNFSEIAAISRTKQLPAKLIDFIEAHKNQADVRFMVRSSSTQEDQAGQSNAGCFETISNVHSSKEAFLTAIQQVQDSFNTQSAKAQSALYQQTTSLEPPVQNHGAIVIQRMIGETVNNPEVPTSGVGLSPDPLSHAPNTFNINAALGHGEGVVQGLVATDQTIGIINRETQEIHARTKVAVQPERLGPKNGEQGLQMLENPLSMQGKAKLSSNAINTYANILDRLAQEHSTGADMEFVATNADANAELFVVQQRSQDALNQKDQPQYLNDVFLATHQHQTYQVQLQSYSSYGVTTLNQDERIVADTLDAAFYTDYLSMQQDAQANATAMPIIKAVFVNPPANPNSHAALMFRQQGIAIVEVKDPALTALLQTSKDQLVLDEQRALLLTNVTPSNTDMNIGMLKYPAQPVYSMQAEHTEITPPAKATLKTLLNRAHNSADNVNAIGVHTLLADLHQILIKDQVDTTKALDIIANLVKKNGALLAAAQKTNNTTLAKTAHEMTIDLLRLAQSLEQADAQPLHRLLYLNWIDAAFNQRPEQHPDLTGIHSIKSALQEEKSFKSFSAWFNAVAFVHAAAVATDSINSTHSDPLSLTPNAKMAAMVLHRLSYTINNPDIKQFWLASLSHALRHHGNNTSSEQQLVKLSKTSLQLMQANTFQAQVGDAFLQKDSQERILNFDAFLKTNTQPSSQLAQLRQTNTQLAKLTNTWAHPAGFDARLQLLKQLKDSISKSLAELNQQNPFLVIATLKNIETLTEQLDLALKSILTSQAYPEPARRNDFIQLLKNLNTLATPLLEQAYRHSPYVKNLDQPKRNDQSIELGYYQTFTDMLSKKNLSLGPSQDFNVSQAVITRTVDKCYTSLPSSIGDIHTLLHQNIRLAIGQIALDQGALRCIPAQGQALHNAITKLMHEKTSQYNSISERGLTLTSITPTDSGFRWQYALPLRDHGVRLSLDLNSATNQLNLAIIMDGNSENNRYEIATSLIQNAKRSYANLDSFTAGQKAWPEPETGHANAFSWQEIINTSTQNQPDVLATADKLTSVLREVINTSYAFSDGKFEDENNALDGSTSMNLVFDESKFINRIFKMINQVDTVNEQPPLSTLLANQDLEAAALLLQSRFQPMLNQDDDQLLKYQHIPLDKPISLAELKQHILEQGLLEEKIGIYEFCKVIKLNNNPIAKNLLEVNQKLYWALSISQLEALNTVFEKKQAQHNANTEEPFNSFNLLPKIEEALGNIITLPTTSSDYSLGAPEASPFVKAVNMLITQAEKQEHQDLSQLGRMLAAFAPKTFKLGLELFDSVNVKTQQFLIQNSELCEKLKDYSRTKSLIDFLQHKDEESKFLYLKNILPVIDLLSKIDAFSKTNNSSDSPYYAALQALEQIIISDPTPEKIKAKIASIPISR